MSFNEVITFGGGINTDDTPQAVPKGDYRDFSYCRLGYNAGNALAVTTSDGTVSVFNPGVGVEDQIIGATPWLKENSIVYFVYKATLIHEIWVYNITDQTHTVAVQDTVLNFDRDWPVYHANVVDDILKWTDGRWDDQMYLDDGTRLFNPPYQINLRRALDIYYTIVDLQVLDAIKWPLAPPFVSYITDTTRNDNKLRKKLFRFMVQPIYENGEIGVWSMYSNLPFPSASELITGSNFLALNNDNGINITFDTGPQVVRKINVAVQQYDQESNGATPPWGVFLELDKNIDSIGDNVLFTYTYYGDVATKPAVNALKNYDRLPVTAYCQEYLPTNQLVYTNFREGYDKIDIASVPPGGTFPTRALYDLREIDWNPFYRVEWFVDYPAITGGAGYYQINLALYDYTVNFPYEAGMVFFAQGPTGNPISLSYQLSQEDINIALSLGNATLRNQRILEIVGDAFMVLLGWGFGSVSANQYQFTAGDDNLNSGTATPLVRTTRQTQATPSLKVGATHQFGIVYGDRAYRDGTVLTSENLNLFIPWFYDIDRSGLDNPQNPFIVNGRISIEHQPPIWADKYWIVAKPATEVLSFGHYIVGGSGGYPNAIVLDSTTQNRYRIEIDNFYSRVNNGAVIQHQIQKGDRVRFIRRRASGNAFDATSISYLPYLELEVLEYAPGLGSSDADGSPARDYIYVSLFDPGLIEDDFSGLTGSLQKLFGQVIEIYTPRPAIDDNGNLFISTWQDVTDSFPILNAHTNERAHGINYDDYVVRFFIDDALVWRPYITGDVTAIINGSWNFQRFQNNVLVDEGSFNISNATYVSASNFTQFTIPAPLVGNAGTRYFITQDRSQEWDSINNELVLGAIINLAYGDVYLRLRNYKTGLIDESSVYYYYLEDPNYSDYWLSDVHQTGRLRFQDPDGKMTHRQATSIHSGGFVIGTQVNGLSSFALDNTNIEDMNPVYGEVVRTYMSGREGKTLKCLQPRKENSIYIQFYPNEVGSDSTVRVSNRTFASWFDYKSLFGCSDSGATAILPNGATMYFDNRAGVFVYSAGNGQILVSETDTDSGKDYKFRTKTKALAASYNASTDPYVRTYVNESVGEVGFAFRFDVPFTGEAFGGFSPPASSTEAFIIPAGNFEYLYGYDMVFYFNGTGNAYSGTVNFVQYVPFFNFTFIGLEGVTPDVADYLQPGYYYTTSGLSYDHVVFDYVNMRWRSTYDYNFRQFCNLGQTLVGWGTNNQLYVHNQPGSWDFHGEPFTQKVSFVSNEEPLRLKRYQDITLVSDELFSITAQSEPNRSYPLGMKTTMPTALISTYEGYGGVNYRKNLYDAKFFVDSNTITTAYDPPTNPVNGWVLPGDQTSLLNDPLAVPPIFPDTITIIQDNGNIYTGQVSTAVYAPGPDTTTITLVGAEPGTIGETGTWYFSERALCNGQDIRANALTHTLEYDPTINNTSSILVSVGIKGVLS